MAVINGTAGDDNLIGTDGDDTIDGGAGNDVINGGFGTDTIRAGDGDDRIVFTGVSIRSPQPPMGLIDGGAGFDTVDARAVAPLTVGTQQNSSGQYVLTLFVGNQRYELQGVEAILLGPGNDTISPPDVSSPIAIYAGEGNDTAFIRSPISLYAEDGDDFIFLSGFGSSAITSTIDGGAGTDTIRFNISFTVDVAAGTASAGTSSYLVSGFERYEASAVSGYVTTIRGSAAGEILAVSSVSNDGSVGVVFDGRGGNDTLLGSKGNDTLTGGAGDDLIVGDDGQDTAIFDSTFASAKFFRDGTDVIVVSGDGTDRVRGIETFRFAGTNYTLADVTAATQALPTMTAVFPVDGATGVNPLANVALLFSAAVSRGAGSIVLARANGTVVETFDAATSTRLSFSGNQLIVDPTKPLDAGTGYTLTVAGGALNVGGVSYGGLTGYDFSTLPIDTVSRFDLVLDAGAAATVAGLGTVVGTAAGLQDVTVLDTPGRVIFDPSFNAGGDIIRLAGVAANYTVSRSGSTLLLNDGDSVIGIPIGLGTVDLRFADGNRSLVLDTAAGVARLGGQSITTTPTALTAAAGSNTVTAVGDPSSIAALQVVSGAQATAYGNVFVVGTTNGSEKVAVSAGAKAMFDPSFNSGGDVISLAGNLSSYSAARSGSSIVLTSGSERVTIPVGLAGSTIRFNDAERTLVYDTAAQTIKLGSQAIGNTSSSIAAGAAPTSVTLTGSAFNAGTGDFRLVQSGETSPAAASVTGFGRGDSLVLQGDAAKYVFSGGQGNIVISYIGSDGSLHSTTLVGIADPSIYINDRSSAEAAAGFGLFGV